MLSLRNVYLTDEITDDSMMSFISTLKPCSFEIDVARLHQPVDLSSERFLEAFANDPNIKYSFEVVSIKADYELQYTPSKGFLERILPRFTNFRLQYVIVNVDRLFDLISIGLALCKKMSWAFAVEEIHMFYLVEPRFEDRAREAGFEHRNTRWARAVQRAGEKWTAYVYYDCEDNDDIVAIIFSNEDRE
ncbi:hypothetical protein PFISCL1PPCAC_4201 [Pristionchus fissidentatus]|uniref:Uncharacterized protein n=1 Tax=Pristionchus fissidentatus TaxID=1538716 RepID=A0AAV5V0K1_9BILA|nr:hypothetical protein PFISCL1PPCAC_4201 [Pristionchus fissidentatus]